MAFLFNILHPESFSMESHQGIFWPCCKHLKASHRLWKAGGNVTWKVQVHIVAPWPWQKLHNLDISLLASRDFGVRKLRFSRHYSENSHSFLAMKLTVCPWKLMIGRRSCPFGKALFHGAVVLSVSVRSRYSKWFRAKVFLLIQGSRRTILSRSSSNFLIWFRQRKRWGKQHDIYDIVTHMFICCWLAWSTWKSEQV